MTVLHTRLKSLTWHRRQFVLGTVVWHHKGTISKELCFSTQFLANRWRSKRMDVNPSPPTPVRYGIIHFRVKALSISHYWIKKSLTQAVDMLSPAVVSAAAFAFSSYCYFLIYKYIHVYADRLIDFFIHRHRVYRIYMRCLLGYGYYISMFFNHMSM